MSRLTISADSHGGRRARVFGFTVHSAETPLKAGYARSLAKNWFGPDGGAPTSATGMVDPADIVRMLPDLVIPYHAGPTANVRFIGWEQAGYAKFSRKDWTTSDGLKQLQNLARVFAEAAEEHDLPFDWASPAELKRAAAGGRPCGLHLHDDVRKYIGGTTHHDAGDNYPKDLLLDYALKFAGKKDDDDRKLPHELPWGNNAAFRLRVGRTGPRAAAVNRALGLGGATYSAKTERQAILFARKYGGQRDGSFGRGQYNELAALTRAKKKVL